MARRERTRHLIELGGLVQKAGLVDLTDDDRATLYGAMLDLAARARHEDDGALLALWKRRGRHAFEAEAAPSVEASGATVAVDAAISADDTADHVDPPR